MKEWLSAEEIAGENLFDLPQTKMGINKLIAREGWNDNLAYVRKREGAIGGGGLEYHYKILPTLAQVAYKQKYMIVTQSIDMIENDIDDSVALVPYENISSKARIERDARIAIVSAFELFATGLSNLNNASKMQVFTSKYAMGYIAVDDWVKEILPEFSDRSLARWCSLIRKGKSNELAVDRAKSRTGTGVLDVANNGKVKGFILALIAQNPHLAAKQIRTLCRDEFGDEIKIEKNSVAIVKSMPPVRTFQHALKGYKTAYKVQLTKLQNPDHYRSTMLPSGVGSLRHVTEPNALWQVDASPVDALCLDGRQNVYACIDIATRRTIFFISKTPRASAVALLIRKAIMAWGVPEKIKTDNGSDFVAHDTKRLLASLDIEMELSDAYSPQQKGHVERVIKTFQHDFVSLVPGYVGHSVADRKVIENRKSFSARLGQKEKEAFGVKYTGPELQKLADRWSHEYYQHQAHSALKGQTPFQVALQSSATIKMVDENALSLLLMPAAGKNGYRTTTKFGIRIDNFFYMTPNILPNTRIFVRQDPNDVGHVYAFDENGGAYLGEGVCAELAGVPAAALAQATREMQAEIIENDNAQLKRTMRQIAGGLPLIERALNVYRRDMPNVIALPKQKTEHSTPQIEAALEAIDVAGAKLKSNSMDEKTAAEQKRLIEEMDAQEGRELVEVVGQMIDVRERELEQKRIGHLPKNISALPESPKQRYVRSLNVKKAVDAGEQVETADALWLGQYQTTPEFIAQSKMHEDFGDEYLGL